MNQAAIKFRGGTMVSAMQVFARRMKMKRKPKYVYIAVIQFKYGDLPWKDVSEYCTTREKKNVMRDLKEYRISGYGQYRAVERRVPNDL